MSTLLKKYIAGDRTIWSIVLMLSLCSIPLIFSTTNMLALQKNVSPGIFLVKQIFFVFLGLMIIYFTHKLDYRYYGRLSPFLFWFIAIPLLVLTLVIGVSINGASRWIAIPGTGLTIQTSEIAKTALVLLLCHYVERKQGLLNNWWKGFLPAFVPVCAVLIFVAPSNLSSAIYIVLMSMIILFIGGAKLSHLLKVTCVAAIPIIVLVSWVMIAHHQQIKANVFPYGRVNVWINRVDDFLYSKENNEPYQVQQAKIAIAAGGLIGNGPGKSYQRNFLPSAFSDYIFAMILAEYGLLGGLFIVILYLILTFRVLRIFAKCPYRFGALVSVALGMDILLSALINISVNADIIPVTGLPLPFLSRGGTSFLISCLNIGIVLSVSRWLNKEQPASSENLPEDLKQSFA